jgi:hypothetical protein
MVVAVLMLNVALIDTSYMVIQRAESRAIRRRMQALVKRGAPVVVNFGPMRSNRARLERAGIVYREEGDRRLIQCHQGRFMPSSTMLYCEDREGLTHP